MEIAVEDIPVTLWTESANVRVKAAGREVILFNQQIDAVAGLIRSNFEMVVGHYRKMIEGAANKFADKDIHQISLIIVMNYLYMYCMWRVQYKQHRDKDLCFDTADLDYPSTHDAIFFYLKSMHPKTWREKSAILLGIDKDGFEKYYRSREDYYNR